VNTADIRSDLQICYVAVGVQMMPCLDERDSYRWEDGQRDLENLRRNIVPKLCMACTLLEENGLLPTELAVWWNNHKVNDEMRRQQDSSDAKQANGRKSREEYLASIRDRLELQLTDEEKEAIGVWRIRRHKDKRR
jgi:hypothetical protein